MKRSSIRIRTAMPGDAPFIEILRCDPTHRRGWLTRGGLVIPVADMVKPLPALRL